MAVRRLGYVVLPPIGGVLGLYLGLMADAMSRDPSRRHLVQLLHNWQTLTAGVFALVAAVVGAMAVMTQVTEAARGENERRERRARALRAGLPLTLAELTDHALACVRLLAPLSPVPNSVPLDVPVLPAGVAATLVELVEASDADTGNALAALIRHVQITHWRLRDVQARASGRLGEGAIVTPYNVASCLADLAEVVARCHALFPFARGEAGLPPATGMPDKLRRVVPLLRLDAAMEAEVEEVIALRQKASEDTAARVMQPGRSWLSRHTGGRRVA